MINFEQPMGRKRGSFCEYSAQLTLVYQSSSTHTLNVESDAVSSGNTAPFSLKKYFWVVLFLLYFNTYFDLAHQIVFKSF